MNNKLKELRKAKGWTLEQLAEKSGTSAATIGKIEREKVATAHAPSVLLWISQALGEEVSTVFPNPVMIKRESKKGEPKALKTVKLNVRKKRYEKGLTPDELAEMAGVCLATIMRMERNIASIDTLYLVAKALGCTMDELVEERKG